MRWEKRAKKNVIAKWQRMANCSNRLTETDTGECDWQIQLQRGSAILETSILHYSEW